MDTTWATPRVAAVLAGTLFVHSLCGCTSAPIDRTVTSPVGHVNLVEQPVQRGEAQSRSAPVVDPRTVKRLPPVTPRPAHAAAVVLASRDVMMADVDSAPSPPEMLGAEVTAGGPAGKSSNGLDNSFPIDLANALRLGGANHLQIQLARERTVEAQIRWLKARASWLPSLRFGIGYNKHDGRLQETQGGVIEVSRNSLFVGGSAGLGDASLAGGASGPARLMVNLSLADAAFEPLVGQQLLDAELAAESATTNNSLLQIAEGYFNLVEAHAQLVNAQDSLAAADEMVRLTTAFFEEGEGAESEVYRAKTEQAHWWQLVQDAQRRIVQRNANLVRLLRLDPGVKLMPVEPHVAPVSFVADTVPADELIARGMAARPELAEHQALIDASLSRLRQECWRPWLPYVQAGASAGTFGGGPSSAFDGQSGRSDVDLLAVWELRNMGIGNAALRRERASQVRQAEVQSEWIRDGIITEIVTAASDAASYRQQMDSARQSVDAATHSYESNIDRIREAEGLPIELLQAIRARATARAAFTKAVSDYNRAQYRLHHALGQPPDA